MVEFHREIEGLHGRLRGMIHTPLIPSNTTAIIYHGYFSANRVGPARLYLDLARYLCNLGINAVRFDCYGVGDSDGSFSEVTFDTYINDYIKIYEFVRMEFPRNEIIIIGHSFGANVVCLIHKIFSSKDLLILLAPEIDFIGGIDTLFTVEQLQELSAVGSTTRKGLIINNSFVKELRSSDILSHSKSIINKCIVVQGNKDELYSIEGAIKLSNTIPNCKFIVVEDADHNFLDLQSKLFLFESIKKEIIQ